MRSYAGIPAKGPVSDETARNMIHGYYACVSYTDSQIGKLLDELDRLEISNNTIVVLWGDHGWNLGEHTLWCKHSCYETSMQIPLIVRAPGINGGQRRDHLIETIDLYPTLCELTGSTLPEHLEGRSFAGLMKSPDIDWKDAAVGRFQDGDTIRTELFRFTEYTDRKGKLVSRMLYDHSDDPNENVNVSGSRKTSTLKFTSELHRMMGRSKQ
jgi:arylsulfatase A-like enzyme